MKLERAVNIDDLRRIAARRLPPPVMDMLAGGAGDELTLDRNTSAFADITFRPRPFIDVSTRDTSTDVFGTRIDIPVMLAPTGAGRVAHPQAELAVARGAADAGTIYMQSTVTSYTLEDVAEASARPLWFQLYLPPERSELKTVLDRVQRAGYSALSVTIDTPAFGNRERDAHNRVTIPARITPKLVVQGATRPAWSMEFLRGNLALRGKIGTNKVRQLSPTATQSQILATQWPVTWDDLKLVRDLWPGPLMVKGLMRADECRQLVDVGVDGVVVSNHGGRQLDGLPATVEVLPSIVQAADGRLDVYLDGGVRRGVDVVKAIALGAKAVFVGRPYLYGLAAGGQEGVAHALEIFRREIDLAMALLGCRTVAEITPDLVEIRRR